MNEENVFSGTFRLIRAVMHGDAFRRWEPSKQTYGGGFNMAQYEAVAIGTAIALQSSRRGRLLTKPEAVPSSDQVSRLKAALETVKCSTEMRTLTVGGGKNFPRIYAKKFKLVSDAVREAL